MFSWRTIAMLILMPLTVGCTSFSSILLHRGESNIGWEREKHLHGIPVTLKVPTHVRVDVLEKHILLLKDRQIRRSEAPFALRQVNYEFIETEKIFMVDVKRPLAGILDTTIDLDADNQYFKKIKESVTDDTIAEISDLIAAVAPSGLFGAPTSDAAPSKLDKEIKEVSAVVASQVFEVDSPDFEILVMSFLNRHLNCCHDCGLLPADAAVPQILPSNYTLETQSVDVAVSEPPLPLIDRQIQQPD